MIKKLKAKIFTVMMVSLSVVVLGVIILFTVLNYRNTINTSTMMVDRFADIDVKRDKNFEFEGERKDSEFELEENRINPEIDIEGVYNIQVKNSEVVDELNKEYDDEIKEYAIKVAESGKESGIIGNYIYRVRKTRDTQMVTLVENEEAISHLRYILILGVVGSIISLVVIFVMAKKLSEIIVKPVEDTFEKQKEFISDASHELKTPLAVIEANTDVIENEIGDNKWIKYIQNEIDSMDKLINELLLLTKIENVDNIKKFENFNVSEEAENVISVFESMAYEKKVKLKRNIQKDVILNGNGEDIEHILSTLIDNAIKHTDEGNEVLVELAKEKSGLILQVKNMGEPIPEEHREKIFERFYRIDKSRNRSQKRYGLGLAIAKSTVEKYNGKIEVFCKDGITTFKVTIP